MINIFYDHWSHDNNLNKNLEKKSFNGWITVNKIK